MTVAVVGAGSWGTALAAHLRRRGERVRLWAREPEVVAGIRARRRNPYFLSDVDLPDGLEVQGLVLFCVSHAQKKLSGTKITSLDSSFMSRSLLPAVMARTSTL